MCLLWSVGASDVVCLLSVGAWALQPLVGVYWRLRVCVFNDIHYPLMSVVGVSLVVCGCL